LLLFDLLSDIIKTNDVLLIVKTTGAVSEIRSNSLNIKQKEKWITIGDNDGPAHLHIDTTLIKTAKFIEDQKSERTSFSVQFFDQNDTRILGAFFTKMYDEHANLDSERKKIFDNLCQEYDSKLDF
jgi:putative heme iron utilization protein